MPEDDWYQLDDARGNVGPWHAFDDSCERQTWKFASQPDQEASSGGTGGRLRRPYGAMSGRAREEPREMLGPGVSLLAGQSRNKRYNPGQTEAMDTVTLALPAVVANTRGGEGLLL